MGKGAVAKLGLLVIVAGVIGVLLAGAQTTQGEAILTPAGEMLQGIWAAISGNMPTLSTGSVSRDTLAAVAVAGVVGFVVLLLVPGANSGRGRLFLTAGVIILAVVLAQSNVLG